MQRYIKKTERASGAFRFVPKRYSFLIVREVIAYIPGEMGGFSEGEPVLAVLAFAEVEERSGDLSVLGNPAVHEYLKTFLPAGVVDSPFKSGNEGREYNCFFVHKIGKFRPD